MDSDKVTETNEIKSLAEMAIEFEAVTVNDRGEIVQRQMHRARQFSENLAEGVTLKLVLIPGGPFLMGSEAGQGYDDERPLHRVAAPSFLMGKYPITQEQWTALMGQSIPFRCRGNRRPADRVSWELATSFCERLAAWSGRAYRLPSEAEWEYACRAATTTPFHFGETITTDLANYVGEFTYGAAPRGVYRHETTDVGTFPPNAFGLYDMHGNVWEWCADAWHADYVDAPADGSARQQVDAAYRVLRGGCWHDPPDLCRSATRLKHVATEGEDFYGFRVVISCLPTGWDSKVP